MLAPMAVNLIRKILLDALVLVAVIVAFIVLRLVVTEPYRRGYFAEDMTIRLPYKRNTVSFGLLTGVAMVVCIFTILATEFRLDKRDSIVAKYYLLSFPVPTWLWKSYIGIGIFGFGVACQQLTVDIAKLVIGRLRPHFYDTCRPVPVNATAYQYITEYKCSKSDLKEARLSFPSGHSCFAMYSAMFIIMYVQSKVNWDGSKLLRHGYQVTVLMMAWYVCLSRVSDHMHHWNDVAAGIILGLISAGIVYNYILLPELKKPDQSRDHSDNYSDRFHIYKLDQTPTSTY